MIVRNKENVIATLEEIIIEAKKYIAALDEGRACTERRIQAVEVAIESMKKAERTGE